MKIRHLIAAGALFFASGAGVAETLVHKNPNGSYAKLFDEKCENRQVLDHVPDEFKALMKRGYVYMKETGHDICWVKFDDETVLQFENGEMGVVPSEIFKPLLEVGS